MIHSLRRVNSRKALPVVVLTFVIATFLQFFTPLLTPTVSAAPVTEAEKKACYDTYDGKTIEDSFFDAKEYNAKCAGYCKANPSNNKIINCPNPADASEAVVKAAADAEVKPLVELICGLPPASEQLQERYVTCGSGVRTVYKNCSATGAGVPGLNTAESTAKCAIVPLNSLKEGPDTTVAAVQAAIVKGRADSAAVLAADKQTKSDKSACEQAGGTWENNKCNNDPGEATCNGGGLGWLICQGIAMITGFNEVVFAAIQTQLFIDPLAVQTGGPLFQVWTTFRDIANAAFVIAFLVVIYSQATGAGLSSYGVKKMLPRLLVAAILVNISFFICQVCLDLSNIVGKSLGSLLDNVAGGINIDPNVVSWSGLVTMLISGGAVFGVGAAVAGAGGIGAAATLLLPFAVTALFAALTAIVILIARQAILILLIAVSPLAFVAFILPNTAKYFERWRELFATMLFLYPLVALLFAGSKLAAWIIIKSGTQ